MIAVEDVRSNDGEFDIALQSWEAGTASLVIHLALAQEQTDDVA
jgi:hypothetical protein